jgi:hypothetical protein
LLSSGLVVSLAGVTGVVEWMVWWVGAFILNVVWWLLLGHIPAWRRAYGAAAAQAESWLTQAEPPLAWTARLDTARPLVNLGVAVFGGGSDGVV